MIIAFLIYTKIDIDSKYLIAHKLLNKTKVSLDSIKNIFIENRHFIAEGRFSSRKAIIVLYIETSGYTGELIFNYNEEMYNYLKKALSVNSNLHDNKYEEEE